MSAMYTSTVSATEPGVPTKFTVRALWLLATTAWLAVGLAAGAGCMGPDDGVTIAAPPAGTLAQFNVFGDSRDGNPVYARLIDTALSSGTPAFNLHLGDMISEPYHAAEWPVFMSVSGPLVFSGGLLPVIGNHDVDDGASLDRLRSVFPDIPPTGYYARTLGSCFVVFLNSEETDTPRQTLSAAQLAWLEDRLASAEALAGELVIVCIHRPPFPQNHHAGDPLVNAEALHQIMVDHGVRLVLAGHEHSYTRRVRDGVTYVISARK